MSTHQDVSWLEVREDLALDAASLLLVVQDVQHMAHPLLVDFSFFS
jgi:hypothetical protein